MTPDQVNGALENPSSAAEFHRSRGLGSRPLLRQVCVLLWASFLGAVAVLTVLVLLPESWPLPPDSLDGYAAVFALAWLLSLIPAGAAGALITSRRDAA